MHGVHSTLPFGACTLLHMLCQCQIVFGWESLSLRKGRTIWLRSSSSYAKALIQTASWHESISCQQHWTCQQAKVNPNNNEYLLQASLFFIETLPFLDAGCILTILFRTFLSLSLFHTMTAASMVPYLDHAVPTLPKHRSCRYCHPLSWQNTH